MNWEMLNTIFSGVTALTVILGVVKIYFTLKFFSPHNHGERGEGTMLTTDGIAYPRGTKNGD